MFRTEVAVKNETYCIEHTLLTSYCFENNLEHKIFHPVSRWLGITELILSLINMPVMHSWRQSGSNVTLCVHCVHFIRYCDHNGGTLPYSIHT